MRQSSHGRSFFAIIRFFCANPYSFVGTKDSISNSTYVNYVGRLLFGTRRLARQRSVATRYWLAVPEVVPVGKPKPKTLPASREAAKEFNRFCAENILREGDVLNRASQFETGEIVASSQGSQRRNQFELPTNFTQSLSRLQHS